MKLVRVEDELGRLASAADQKAMCQDDLKRGDLVFFHGAGGDPEHVAMYTGQINGYHYITHSVNAKDKSNLQTSILRSSGANALGRYSVCRLNNIDMAHDASDLLEGWARYHPPFDLKRTDLWVRLSKPHSHNVKTPLGLSRYMQYAKRYGKAHFYSRIKYAARRNTMAHFEYQGKAQRGWTCIGAVMTAIQVAEIAKRVTPLEELPFSWISDKYCDPALLRATSPGEEYLLYRDALSDCERYEDFCIKVKCSGQFKSNTAPSIAAWRGAGTVEAFVEKFESVLPLDAKITSPGLLYHYCLEDALHWTCFDSLDVRQRPMSPRSKEQWLSVMQDDERIAQAQRQKMIKRYRLVCLSDIKALNQSVFPVIKQPPVPAQRKAPSEKVRVPHATSSEASEDILRSLNKCMGHLIVKSFELGLRSDKKSMMEWLRRTVTGYSGVLKQERLSLVLKDIRNTYRKNGPRQEIEKCLLSLMR